MMQRVEYYGNPSKQRFDNLGIHSSHRSHPFSPALRDARHPLGNQSGHQHHALSEGAERGSLCHRGYRDAACKAVEHRVVINTPEITGFQNGPPTVLILIDFFAAAFPASHSSHPFCPAIVSTTAVNTEIIKAAMERTCDSIPPRQAQLVTVFVSGYQFDDEASKQLYHALLTCEDWQKSYLTLDIVSAYCETGVSAIYESLWRLQQGLSMFHR